VQRVRDPREPRDVHGDADAGGALSAAPDSGDLTFGEAMDRLEAIVSQLEGNEELGLEEALALYERGLDLAGDCRRRLATAQLKLTQIPVPADAIEDST
jgi:exodeoxyribonuclease VII small subunit